VTEQDNGDAWVRPADAAGEGFAPREPAPTSYAPPPLTVSPQEQAVFGRPAGVESFQPAPGERLVATRTHHSPVPPEIATAYRPGPGAQDGFDPSPGSRLRPSGPPPESPWWKKDARQDPWRDPNTPFWLGGGAIFTKGRPAQLDPEFDTESEHLPDEPDLEADDDLDDNTPGTGRGRRRAVVTTRRFGLGALGLSLAIALVAGALGGGAGYWLAHRLDKGLHKDNVALTKVDTPANRPPGSVADIAKRVGPAVVSISVTTPQSYGVGSGVVIDPDGYVLTNNHVIADAADGTATIEVTFSDEATADAEIVGRDPVSDLAVIKVPSEKLTVATLGDSAALAVGDPVVAIGSPLGLSGTVTEGIVSAKDRAVHVYSEDGTSDAYLNAIQTDAAINPGNSGGALVDAAGAVVGINSAGRFTTPDAGGGSTPVSGIGYAIPINYARDIATDLIKTGKTEHASLGAQGRSVTDGSRLGAYLVQVEPSGPAAAAGLKNGDVIVVAGGHRILSFDQLAVLVQTAKPGAKLELTYYRGSTKVNATVTLGTQK